MSVISDSCASARCRSFWTERQAVLTCSFPVSWAPAHLECLPTALGQAVLMVIIHVSPLSAV